MKIVLRDDDTCYYTHPEELIAAFDDLYNIPISLSVIPFATYKHAETNPFFPHKEAGKYMDIAENVELVRFLQKKVIDNHFEIMLHGIHHEYRNNCGHDWKTEMQFYTTEELVRIFSMCKKHLETLFNQTIGTFIGPSNDISPNCAAALDYLGLNTNYTVSKKFNRLIAYDNVSNYLRCNLYKLLTAKRYRYPLKYRNHMEIASVPFENYEQIIKIYNECRTIEVPLVMYTHYWSLNKSIAEKRELSRFVSYALSDGAEFVTMKYIWNNFN